MAAASAILLTVEWQLQAMPQNFVPLNFISVLNFVALGLIAAGGVLTAKSAWQR
jgi:hypothetical protein